MASVVLHVEALSELQEDVVIVESIYQIRVLSGVGINSLVSTDPVTAGGAVFHDTCMVKNCRREYPEIDLLFVLKGSLRSERC